MKKPTTSLLLLSLAMVAGGCGTPPADPPPDPPSLGTPLATAESGELKLELYARGPLEVGRNEVAYRLIDTGTGAAISKATLTQKPLMTMAERTHRCPLTQPGGQADEDGRFVATLIPIMPGGELGTWSLEVDALPEGEATATTFSLGNLEVKERAIPARKDLVVGEEKLVVTLNFVAGAPKVGSNEVIVTVHKSVEMGMMFPPQTNLALHMTPEMPTMGHGSSGNVDPTHQADGEYRGTVNFNMAGAWRLTFDVQRDGASLGKVVYDFTL